MKFNDVKAFIDNVDFPMMMDYVEGEWCQDNGTFYHYWEGDVYSFESREAIKKLEDFTVINGDTCSGYWITTFYKNNSEMDYYDFCNKYEGQM